MAIKVLSTTDILGATFQTGSPRLTVGAPAEVSQLNFQYSTNFVFTSYSNQLFLQTGNNGVMTIGAPTGGNTSNLAVQGYVDAKNFKIDGAQGSDGQVLTSTGSGVAWESVSTSGGDITAVVAGAGLTGGSTSGSATLNLDIDGTNNYIEMNNAYTPASGDFIPFSDIADSTGNGDNNVVRKTTFSNFPETTMPSIKITDIAGSSPHTSGSSVTVPMVNSTTGVIDDWVSLNRTYNGVLTVTGSSGLTGSGTFGANQSSNTTITLSHSDTSSQGTVNNSNGTVIQDVTLDGYGHVTALGSVNLDGRYFTETEADARYVTVAGNSQSITGTKTFTSDITLDDGSGDSPHIIFQDDDDIKFRVYNADNNDFYITREGNSGADFVIHADSSAYTSSYLTIGGATVSPTRISQWNTAYGWGNHASANYVTVAGNSQSITGSKIFTHSDGLKIMSGSQTNAIRLYTENDSTPQIADSFSGNTAKSFIYFDARSGSNDPGYIMHETSSSEANEGVLHLCPSDDNSTGDYVSIHGTNDSDVLKLHTSGLVETVNLQLQLKSGVNELYLNDSIIVSGSSTFQNNVHIDGSGSSGNAFSVDRGSDGAGAFRVHNTGEVVTSANYFYAASAGTSMYVQNTAVFRGSIINDGSGAPVRINDTLQVDNSLNVTGLTKSTTGFTTDSNNRFYTWRALDNTSSSSNQYYRIARITGSQSSRFIIELAGRSSSYGNTSLPAFGKIVGQLNNDNDYDIVYYNASATDEVVDEVGQVDVSTTATDIYVRVGQFSELTATAHISDGSITTYGGDSASTSAPSGYVQATEYKLWNAGNDGSGSGLDADTLDGQHASAFLTAHPNISAASSSNNSGNTFIQDLTLDSNGHVTGLATGSASGFLTSESDTLATVTGRGATTTTSCTFNTITMNTPVVGSSNKIKFANNDFIRYDDANGVGRFHFDADGGTNNASLQAATFVGALNATGGISGLTISNGISGNNYNISGVNQLSINDPGEGIVFGGGSSGNLTLTVVDDSSDNILRLTGTGATLQVGTNRVLTTADEGSGNGLDADTLDGNHASAFLTAHPNISAASSSNNSGRTYIQDITLDSNGHVTGIGTATETVTNTDTNNYLSSASFNTGNGVITFNRNGLSAVTVDIDNRYAYYDHIRSLGTPAFTNGSNPNITTAQLISEIESDGGFDSRTSVFKTSWSYAGNYNLTDAGRFTETAGTSWITWTDNSSDTVRGNITAMAICPTTGASAHKVFIYNDQGSTYSPGWREVWTSASDGAGSGLDADLLDGQQGSHYLDYNNFTNVPSSLASSTSGNRWGVNGFIGTDGVMEVGRYIDFHTSDGDTSDYAHRLTVTGSTLYFSAGISGTSAAFSSTCDFNSHVEFYFSSGSRGTRIETASTAVQTLRCDSDRFRFYMGGGSGEVFTIEQSGKIGIKDSTPDYPLDVNHNVSNTSIYASHDIVAYSDIRVKKDIETIPDALDKVNKLRGVTYKRTDEGSTDRTMMGVIAQEVEEVIPEVVSTKESDGHKAVAYGNMVGVLIEAVKELTEKVRILEEKLKDK